ncbi:hypothetical protein MRX96_037301 [Rhipicephalus microplus]
MDSLHCYCSTADVDTTHMLRCTKCKLYFHPGCLKSSNRSTLVGDLFFKLTCDRCSPDNVEVLERLKMQWIQVIMLTLYNLHVSGTSGKLGYFRWREHICSFIDKHWTTFFGDRKRTATFRGTVAGVLSSGCPLLFPIRMVQTRRERMVDADHNEAPHRPLILRAPPLFWPCAERQRWPLWRQ